MVFILISLNINFVSFATLVDFSTILKGSSLQIYGTFFSDFKHRYAQKLK